jgi:5-(carboxyamino)imidazole ribonucleotide synthase
MGIELHVLAESEDSSARATDLVVGDYRDLDTVLSFSSTVDVVTFDHEHVPYHLLQALTDAGVIVRPGAKALLNAQDKTVMRRNLTELAVHCPRWAVVHTLKEVGEFFAEGPLPVIAKTPRGGYDGKGVRVVSSGEELVDWLALGEVLLEELVDFRREVAQLVARRPSGQISVWPLVETRQKNGVCSEVLVPAPGAGDVVEHAREISVRIAEGLDVTGVLAVEMFEGLDGSLLVNELAMRPHNSGHIFTEFSETSQFEQHLRAVLDWPLGATSSRALSGVMVNIFGGVADNKKAEALALSPSLKVHDYGKTPRAGRKAGHISAIGANVEELLPLANKASALCGIEGLE